MVKKAIRCDKTHVPILVKLLNFGITENPRPFRYKINTTDLEKILCEDKKIEAIAIYNGQNIIGTGIISNIDTRNHKCKFTCLAEDPIDMSDIWLSSLTLLNNIFDYKKIYTEIIGEKNPILYTLAKLGFGVDLRRREHYFSDNRFTNIVECSLIKPEITNERFESKSNTSREE